jgi:DHA2 family multidrug resistance protein
MATTALIRRAAQHQNDLGAHLSPTNPVLQQKSMQIAGYLAHRIGPNAARPGSYGLIYGLMEQQAALKAYVDVFRWTALLAFFCAGAVWLFKKPIKHAEPPVGIH